jgi:hypothetical protein
MSTNLTEEASKLRANAAASLIQRELEWKELARDFSRKFIGTSGNIVITSTTSDDLANNELKMLLAIANRFVRLSQQLSRDTPIVCSAIAASSAPTSIAQKITSIINCLDTISYYLNEASAKLSSFEDATTFSAQYDAIYSALDIFNVTSAELNKVLDQLHSLLFGG